MLTISEVFGPTLQGEGPSLGRRAGFVRVGRCPLACSWCDSAYTWRWDDHDPAVELTTRDAASIAVEIDAMDVPLVVITGGEPLAQQRELVALLKLLHSRGHEIEVETAGIIGPSREVFDLVDRFNVSPKLANSGNPLASRYRPQVLQTFALSGKAVFKFVVVDAGDLDEVQTIVDTCKLTNVWIMPEGTDSQTLAARHHALADGVIARGWNMTTRLHILLWGNERGR